MDDFSGFSPEIRKRLEALPQDVRKLVYSADMDKVLQQIATKHRLHIDKIEPIEAETVAVMIGMTQPEEFVSGLIDGANLDQKTAETVAKDVNDQLFAKIRESMKKPPAPTTTPPPAPKPPPPVFAPKPPPPPPLTTPPQKPPAPPLAQPPKPPAPSQSTADIALTQKVVSTPPKPPTPQPQNQAQKPTLPSTSQGQAKPPPYTIDPYREPPK